MEKAIKGDILSVLQGVRLAFQRHDSAELKRLSNMTIHDASIFQDQDSISAAIAVYSLSKVSDRFLLSAVSRGDQIERKILDLLGKCSVALRKDDLMLYRRCIKGIFQVLGSFEKKFGLYMTEVLTQARVKKGSKLYEHGISAAQTASLLGISQWELRNYLGAVREKEHGGVSAVDRLSFARKIFGA